jgi:hypothetical protein
VNDQAATDDAAWEMNNDLIRRNAADLAQVFGFERVNFNLGAGDDSFDYASASTSLRAFVDGGAGHDTISANETATTLELTILSSAGDDDVNVNPDGVGIARVLFSASGRFGAIGIDAGGTAIVQEGGTRTVTFTAVTVSGDGVLNLNDNAMIVDYATTTPLASIAELLTAGYAGGAWNGVGGIHSTTAGANAGTALGYAEASSLFTVFPATFAGEQVDDSTVLVRYTLAGDANLDRAVNIGDFSLLAAGYNSPAGWSGGNFNYDADVNIADFSLLASAFNSALPAEAASALETAPYIAKAVLAVARIEDKDDQPRLIDELSI